MFGSAYFTDSDEQVVGRLEDLSELGSARPVVSTTNCASTSPSTLRLTCSMSG
jgi:hypothetical protein